MLLIVGDESRYAEMSEEEGRAQMQRWTEYTKDLVDAGAFVAGEGLQTSTTATTVRVQDGERLLTDGPFAETKEQIGGFYLIDCANLDEAVDWAAKLPSAEWGVTEIRPVMDTGDAGGTAHERDRQGAAS
jgi:hypothetical protein